MRISNWAVLFAGLFLIMILLPNLRARYSREAQYTMEEYNKILDRAAEDALMDQVQEEFEDGSLKIDKKSVQKRFLEQTAFMFDLMTSEERENFEKYVCLAELVNERGSRLRQEERIHLQEQMEQLLWKNSKLQKMHYLLYFPTTGDEPWVNAMENHSFYSFLEWPDHKNYAWTKLFESEKVRYSFSGAQVVKKAKD